MNRIEELESQLLQERENVGAYARKLARAETKSINLEDQLRQEREARESHECGDTCDALQAQVAQLRDERENLLEQQSPLYAQVAQLQTTVGQLRKMLEESLALVDESPHDKRAPEYLRQQVRGIVANKIRKALATCPAPVEEG